MKPKVLITALLLSSLSCLAAERPNILWMFTDDHAYQALGAYGGRFESLNLTPNLDRLAREGMLFEKAYVANSICAPSRATLLTGKHSHKNGKIDNETSFDHSQQQFQKILQKHGYQTAMVGKIHLDGKMQGFDYWEVLPGQGKYWSPVFITAEGTTRYPDRHSTEVVTERAIHWLENGRKQQEPFMLMVHYKAPHRKWQPMKHMIEKFKDVDFPEPDTLFDSYEGRGTAAHEQDMTIRRTMNLPHDLKAKEGTARLKEYNAMTDPKEKIRWKYQTYMRDYLACVAGVDENVGTLLEYLKESGLDKNTVVMYSSDQGFYLGEHGWFDKRFIYEESFRTPFIAKWPGVIAPGSVNRDLVQNIDFAETFLDIAGAEIPEDMQGASLLPLFKGQRPDDWRKHLYYHYYEYPGIHNVRRHEGVSDGRYKLIRFYGMDVPNGEEWELYDLEKDPQEMRSEAENPEYMPVMKRLKHELQNLREHYEVTDIPQTERNRKPKKN